MLFSCFTVQRAELWCILEIHTLWAFHFYYYYYLVCHAHIMANTKMITWSYRHTQDQTMWLTFLYNFSAVKIWPPGAGFCQSDGEVVLTFRWWPAWRVTRFCNSRMGTTAGTCGAKHFCWIVSHGLLKAWKETVPPCQFLQYQYSSY